MDVFVPGLHDRREAAADENRTANGRQIYARGTSARRLSDRDGNGRFDIQRARFSRIAANINTVVLHQTDFFCSEPVPKGNASESIQSYHRFDKIIAHFVITDEGQIIYTHDIEHMLNSVSGRFGIDIEFEGGYGHSPVPEGTRLSEASIIAGRRLLLWLNGSLPSIQHIHPHGQLQSTGGKRDSCPGPDIWVNVGQWAVENLGFNCDEPHRYYSNRGISEAQSFSTYQQDVS